MPEGRDGRGSPPTVWRDCVEYVSESARGGFDRGKSVTLEKVLGWLLRPERALENAREASTALSRRRVEHAEVAIFLEEQVERRSKSRTA